MPSFFESRLFRFSLIGAVFLFVVYFSLFISHGFDLDDEGWYYLGYSKNQLLSFNVSGFQALIKTLPYSDNVIINRLERFLLHVIVSLLFAYSIKKNIVNDSKLLYVFFWILLGNLMSYAYSPISLSYNTINLLLIQILTSLQLFYLNNKIKANYLKSIAFLIFVFLFSIMVFNKLTSSILFALCVILVNSIIENNCNVKYWVRASSVFVLGGFLSILWFVTSFDFPMNQFLSYLKIAYSYDVYPKHDLLFHIKQLTVNPIYHGKFLFVFVFLLIFFSVIKEYFGKNSYVFNQLSVFVLMIFAGIYYTSHYHFGFGSEYYLIIILFILFINFEKIMLLGRREKILIFYFLFLPVIGFFGSDVSPFEGYNHYAVFYFLVIMLIYGQLNYFYFKILPLILVVILITRCMFFPFGYNQITTLNIDFSIKNNSRIKIDQESYEKVNELDTLLKKYSLNKDIIFINLPAGMVFLTGQTNLFNPYYNNPLCFSSYIKCLKLKKLPNVFYIVRRYGLMDIKYDLYRNFVNDLLHYKTEYIYVGDKYEIIKYTTAK